MDDDSMKTKLTDSKNMERMTKETNGAVQSGKIFEDDGWKKASRGSKPGDRYIRSCLSGDTTVVESKDAPESAETRESKAALTRAIEHAKRWLTFGKS
jgi:hypothetical protein